MIRIIMRRSRPGRRRWTALRRGAVRFLRRPFVRRIFWGATLTFAVVAVALAGLWWRLSSGPIELDMATPWLKAAIEKNFGGNQTVSVGGTQIERDENGRTSLRLRDIVVRDADGTVVATAPKAEVGISGIGLLTGKVRAESLNLVGAEMSVRIETDGRVTVFAGADKRPIATASATLPPALTPAQPGQSADALVPQGALRAGLQDVAGILTWIDGLGATGLDGHDLRELGLKNGNLIVDDQRNGKQWTFSRINVSLTRPTQGGVIFRLASDTPDRPWVFSAAMRPLSEGVRAVGIEARNVSSSDILLALRLNEGDIEADLPLSASVRAEILSDGTLQRLQGQVIADAGTIVDRFGENTSIKIDHADIRFNWDARQRALIIPFQIQSGGNQFTMRATLEAPADQNGVWLLSVTRGDPVIDPVILASAGKPDEEGIAINRVAVRARIDTVRRRIDLDQGDFSRIDTRPLYNVAVAVTGSLDYSGAEPHLAFGVAGTRMPTAVMKRLWPVFAAVQVREWVEDHISGGMVERVVIAGNAPLPNFKPDGPPMPDDGLSVDIETSGTTLRPLATLPAIRDADLTVRITGRTATVNLGRGTVEVTPGRKLNIASGIFEVPDTHPKPAPARVRFRIDGTVPAAAALLASEALRENVGITLDPSLEPRHDRRPGHGQSAARARRAEEFRDLCHHRRSDQLRRRQDAARPEGRSVVAAGDRVLRRLSDQGRRQGQRHAGHDRFEQEEGRCGRRIAIAGDDRRSRAPPARHRFRQHRHRHDSGQARGAARRRWQGRPMSVDADLTPVKIDNLLPGWLKPAGKPARATYTLVKTGQITRFDDLTIDGSGASVKGTVELDNASEIVSANFPVFSLSDGDKVTLKADRGSDGVLRVAMRGDVYDGTQFREVLAGRRRRRSPSTNRPISISTSRSARSSATMARRCAGSISSSRAAAAASAASR